MERTDQDFQDVMALDLFSPKNRTVVVQQNTNPLAGDFVTGSSGGPFKALSNYSYIVTMNETATDLIAKIEIPWPDDLGDTGINPDNTFVGRLAEDGKSWVVSERQRNVHRYGQLFATFQGSLWLTLDRSENNTRIIQMTSLDGEYMLLGRMTEDTAGIFIQYGQGATRTMNVTGGPGQNVGRFVDGLEFTIENGRDMTLNVDLKAGIDEASLSPGGRSLSKTTLTNFQLGFG